MMERSKMAIGRERKENLLGSLTGNNRHAMQAVRIREILQSSYYNDSNRLTNSPPASTIAIVKSHHRTGSFRFGNYLYLYTNKNLGFFSLLFCAWFDFVFYFMSLCSRYRHDFLFFVLSDGDYMYIVWILNDH